LRSIAVGTFELWCEPKIEIIIAEIEIMTGIFQSISLHKLWRPIKAVRQLIAIMKSEVPAALICGV
jgi:hypothetical protein